MRASKFLQVVHSKIARLHLELWHLRKRIEGARERVMFSCLEGLQRNVSVSAWSTIFIGLAASPRSSSRSKRALDRSSL